MLGLDRGGMCRGIAFRVAGCRSAPRPSPICAPASRSRWSIARPCGGSAGRAGASGRSGRCASSSTAATPQYAGRLTLDRAAASCAARSRPVGRQPRLRGRNGAGVGSARLSRDRPASHRRAAQIGAAHRKAEVGDQKPEIRTRRSGSAISISDCRFRRQPRCFLPSATSRAVASSIDASQPRAGMPACRGRAGSGRASRPARCRESGSNERRGQNSPELSATGTQGTPVSP